MTKLVWSGLKDEAPEVYEFLKKMRSSLAEVESIMGWAEEEGIKEITQTRVVARYIRTYEDNVKSWLTEDEWKKVDKALKDAGY